MKPLATTLLLCMGLSLAKAQKVKAADVPAAVKESFKKQFPGSKVEKWEKEDANYEAEFDVNKVETSAVFDANGKWIETEVEIKVADIPKSISNVMEMTMPGKKAKEASKITDAQGVVTYEVEIDDVDYLYDFYGVLLKKETNNEKDKD